MKSIIVILILLAMAGAALWYLLRRKKQGSGCVGCPCAGNCDGCPGESEQKPAER